MASAKHRFTSQPPSKETLAHFQDVPWAMKLISDPTLQPCTNESRIVKPTHTGDTFVARTLATDDTIAAWQSFRSIPAPSAGQGETISILKLGSGVNGHIDICHGGFVSLLLDEILGTAADHARPKNMSSMTAFLKVDYKKPIPTPSVLLCRASIEKIEGRKMWCKGTVEDGEGGIYAIGTALFLVIPKITAKVKL